MVELDSKTQTEVNTVCSKGIEYYLSQKHKEEIKNNLETGILGSFVGASALFGLSRFYKEIKMEYLLFPAALGIISSSIISLMNYNKNDEIYENDFESVCKEHSKDTSD